MTNTDTIHAAKAPLQSPARQAASLIRIATKHGQDIAYVREHIAAEVREGDPRLWSVTGHDQPMTGASYHALVLAEIDRATGDEATPRTAVTGKQYREQAEHVERLAAAIANGQVRGPMHAAVARLVEAVELLRIWTPDDRSI
jgi:hypothetical protein